MREVGLKGKMERAVSLLMIIVSVVGLSENVMAGEKRGAMLMVQKKDGSQVNGELIAVKPNSILLLVYYPGADVSIEVTDINTIKIFKKSTALSGFGLGTLIGALSGVAIGFMSGNDPGSPGWFRFTAGNKAVMGGVVFGVAGGLVGLTAGAIGGIDKTIQIKGKSDLEIQAALTGLTKKARISNFR